MGNDTEGSIGEHWHRTTDGTGREGEFLSLGLSPGNCDRGLGVHGTPGDPEHSASNKTSTTQNEQPL